MEAPVLLLFKTLIDILHPSTKTRHNRQIASLYFDNRNSHLQLNIIQLIARIVRSVTNDLQFRLI